MAVRQTLCPPVIVVPGITACELRDEYALPPEAVWTAVRRKKYHRITLHPSDLRYELHEPARVRHGGTFSLIYEDLVEELRDNLSWNEDAPVPVYPFGYDWRMPLRDTECALAAFVDEVIDRTRLMRHYRENGYGEAPRVHLVGHSMGGLLIAGYLARQCQANAKGRPVDKVVSIGTPFHGSHEAVIKIATGIGDLGEDTGRARERRAARMTPALYHLLPDYDGAIKAADGADEVETDLFTPAAWQPNIRHTVAEFVEKWGTGEDSSGGEVFQAMLSEAKDYRAGLAPLKAGKLGLRWLAVAGANAETRVEMEVKSAGGGDVPQFQLQSSGRANEWNEESAEARVRYRTGDGTVPLQSAVPPFLDPACVVCVTPKDFGYWELGDRVLSRAAGFHGMLPRMNMLHRLIVRFFLGRDDTYGNTWGRPLPDQRERWQPPLALRNKDRGR